jgi:hypothetical protein
MFLLHRGEGWKTVSLDHEFGAIMFLSVLLMVKRTYHSYSDMFLLVLVFKSKRFIQSLSFTECHDRRDQSVPKYNLDFQSIVQNNQN